MRFRANTNSDSVVSKLFNTIFFLVFFVAGCYFGQMITNDFIEGLNTHSFIRTPCTIIDSSVVQDNNYTFQVKYEYSYEDKDYTSDKFTLDKYSSGNYSKVNSLVLKYPAGSAAECFVDPARPYYSVLQQSDLWAKSATLLMPLPFICVGIFGVYFTWKRKVKVCDEENTYPTKDDPGSFVPILVVSIFAIAGTIMFYFLAFRPLYNLYDAKSWVEVPCHIVSASIKSHTDHDDGGVTYSIDILYQYEYSGKQYKSNTYNFNSFWSSSGYKGKQAIVDKYKSMSSPACYVNPNDPQVSVLYRGLDNSYWGALFPLPFMLIGYCGLFWVIKTRKAKNKPDRSDSGEPVVLKTCSPVKNFIGMLFFALMWNGITSVGVYHAFTEGDTKLKLFMMIFLAVGVFTIVLALKALLQCFNPRVTATLQPGVIVPGGSSTLTWTISGNSSKISSLTLKLIGCELETVGHGKHKSVRKTVFYSDTLIESNEQSEIVQGCLGIVIPTDARCTSAKGRIKVKWAIELQGVIKSWPDIKQEFEFTVMPGRKI